MSADTYAMNALLDTVRSALLDRRGQNMTEDRASEIAALLTFDLRGQFTFIDLEHDESADGALLAAIHQGLRVERGNRITAAVAEERARNITAALTGLFHVDFTDEITEPFNPCTRKP